MKTSRLFTHWPEIVPVISGALLYELLTMAMQGYLAILVLVIMMLAVIASVHHAEMIAHRLGEPYGTFYRF
jgi:Ca2+:H+ antiporter